MDKIDIFCGINSVGMPFAKDNKNHISYFDIVQSKLREAGYEVSGVNISRLNKNRTWDLENSLTQSYSLSQLKNMQKQSIDALRNKNVLFRLIISKGMKDKIIISKEDENTILKDLYIKSEKPIFLHSVGENDFFSFIHSGPVELVNKKVRKKLPSNLTQLVEKCTQNVENNWRLLYQLNSNVQIYALGCYDSPLYDKIQKVIFLQEKIKDRSKKYTNKFVEVINLYNYLLQQKSENYDFVHYIDITFLKDYCAFMDFHPNTRGNELIANQILEKIFENIKSK